MQRSPFVFKALSAGAGFGGRDVESVVWRLVTAVPVAGVDVLLGNARADLYRSGGTGSPYANRAADRPRFVFDSHQLRGGAAVDQRMSWSLLDADGRQLGQSGRRFRTVAGCLQAVHRLRADAHRLSVVTEMTEQWTWRLECDGETVATAGRSYLRVAQCHEALDRFLSLVRGADIAPIAGRADNAVAIRLARTPRRCNR